MSNSPLVSICCLTYNHEPYIRDCLEGFVMQQTNFIFEVLIHDDASTDNTVAIIKEYVAKYPDIIKPIYQTENQYSKGVKVTTVFNFPRAEGQYIAMCEGDDYWIDPLKLQKQVDLMVKNPDCSLCFHASKNVNASNPELFEIYRPVDQPKDNRFGVPHAIKYGGGLMATNAMLFKTKYVINRPEWSMKGAAGDLSLTLLMASYGDMLYIDEVMSAYRIAAVGSWSLGMKNNPEKVKTHYAKTTTMWKAFDAYTKGKYTKEINRVLRRNKFICYKFFTKVTLLKLLPLKSN